MGAVQFGAQLTSKVETIQARIAIPAMAPITPPTTEPVLLLEEPSPFADLALSSVTPSVAVGPNVKSAADGRLSWTQN